MPSNKKYYWLKLRSDFFEDPIIDIMSSLPDGDKVQLIYIRLLLKSLKENGYICLPGLLPTMEEELLIRSERCRIRVWSMSPQEKKR